MVVTGTVHPEKVWANSGAEEGDAIILTKPLGTGILTTALKRGLLNEQTKKVVTESMSELNSRSADIIKKFTVHACTDVTGFGLIGHLSEVTRASYTDAEIFAGRIPVFEEVSAMAAANIVPGGTTNNLTHFSKYVLWDNEISDITRLVLCDAQTSGGLLFTVPGEEKEEIITDLHKAGISAAAHIGNCLKKGEGKIFVTGN